MKKITIIIKESEKEIKNAIARGWNERFSEDITAADVSDITNKEDIICAVPYLEMDKITVNIDN